MDHSEHLGSLSGYRLVNSKFPPIALFDDVADAAEFDALFALQALTNPRLRNEVGALHLLPREDIPFGIQGCSYATAPFTHVNPNGSRFSDGSYGVLYIADTITTAITEVKYHQQHYWSHIEGLHYDRFVFRALKCDFEAKQFVDLMKRDNTDPIYNKNDYSHSHTIGAQAKKAGHLGLQYHSVRELGASCWGLLSPQIVTRIQQTQHYEMIWNGESVSSVNQIHLMNNQ